MHTHVKELKTNYTEWAHDGQHLQELYNNIRSPDSDTNLKMNTENYHYCQTPTKEITG